MILCPFRPYSTCIGHGCHAFQWSTVKCKSMEICPIQKETWKAVSFWLHWDESMRPVDICCVNTIRKETDKIQTRLQTLKKLLKNPHVKHGDKNGHDSIHNPWRTYLRVASTCWVRLIDRFQGSFNICNIQWQLWSNTQVHGETVEGPMMSSNSFHEWRNTWGCTYSLLIKLNKTF